jgi:two-component system, cell cycle sensor histidine kinase and response regulator CckA
VLADVGQLQQVLLNLAVNARDAMPNGGALTIETRALTPPETDQDAASFVQLSVADTGVGMPAGVQAHIFEPFFTTKPSGEGTGLGLSTVYGIVNQSGGFIDVRSEVGRGTTFAIHLPRAHQQVAAPPQRDSKPADRGSETILLVEDEESVRRLAARVLERCGYRVLSAADGVEALRICREYDGEIDLVLSDVVMPGMSGPALVERVVAERPRVRTLFMSGYAGDAVTRHGVLEGSPHLLPKPFTSDALGTKVRQVLDES